MRAESEVVGAPTGGMDQTVSLLAHEGHALLIDFADHSRRHLPFRPEAHGLRLLVVDTRASHELVDGGYGSRREECERAADELGVGTLREASIADLDRIDDELLRRRARHVVSEIARVAEVAASLEEGAWARVGELFIASHASMRDDFEISCAELDAVVDTALAEGALGARMTGGGFGGSAIALVREADADRVVDRVRARFAQQGWEPPVVLAAPASAGARRLG
jgi:galactokinase